MSNMIEVKDLVLVYSNGTNAVDHISFNVKKGEFFGFLGPNGAGKIYYNKSSYYLIKKNFWFS